MRAAVIASVLAAALSVTAVAVAAPTGNFNNGQPHSCTFGGTSTDSNLQSESVTCTGTISGLGNNPTPVYVVLVGPAGCSNPGNTDIPGQRRFISGPFTPDANGSVNYTSTGSISCHGNQVAFISDTLTLEAYVCGQGAPRFNTSGQQTNASCTLIDTRSETATP
jgi:hypothetical protein